MKGKPLSQDEVENEREPRPDRGEAVKQVGKKRQGEDSVPELTTNPSR